MEVIFAIFQAIFEAFLSLLYLFIRIFPRMGMAFLLGVAALLFIFGYFNAGLAFVVSAILIFWMRLRKSSK